jgi:hypothetical protein
MVIVRENTEGEYSSIGGRMYAGTEREIVMQETVMSRIGVDRVLRFAFELAVRAREAPDQRHQEQRHRHHHALLGRARGGHGQAYPDVTVDQFHIDILTAHFVQRPDFFDVVVAATCSATSCPTWAGLHRHHRHRPQRQPEPRRALPLAVRAGARLGARHRRPRHRQPDRPDLERRHDAGPPGPPRRARKGGTVSLVGFGSFAVTKRPARKGRNPRTGAEIKIKAAKVPKFRPGKALKDALN